MLPLAAGGGSSVVLGCTVQNNRVATQRVGQIARVPKADRGCREPPWRSGYEHPPTEMAIRRDLRRWISREEFIRLRAAFRYHLSADELTSLESGLV